MSLLWKTVGRLCLGSLWLCSLSCLTIVGPGRSAAQETLPPVVSAEQFRVWSGEMESPWLGPSDHGWASPFSAQSNPPGGSTTSPRPPGRVPQRPSGGSILPGLNSPFSVDNAVRPPEIRSDYDRVLDLYPERHDRQLIERTREAVEQTEVGIDVTDEQWITVRGGGQRITWGGRIDTDFVNWIRDEEFGGQPNYVEFRRLRLMASGEGYGTLEYQLELNISPDAPSGTQASESRQDAGLEVLDAFVAMRDLPWFGYAVLGHFRTPLGLDSLTSTRFIPFLERSLPERLRPGRELGIAAFSSNIPRNLTWSYGIFFDDLDEREQSIIDDNQGTRFISRMTWTPFYDTATEGAYFLHTGLGYSYNRPRLRDDPDGMLPPSRTIQFTARPEIHQGDPLIRTGHLHTDAYHLLNVELAWGSGPFTLQSEGTYIDLQLDGGTSSRVWGSYVYASWFLTGERRPYDRGFAVFRRVVPYENFWVVPTETGTQAGLGAWELAARWSHLNFSDVSGQTLHDLTVGLNWYWNPHTRLMVNWIHPMARNSAVGTASDSDGDLLAARFQVDF